MALPTQEYEFEKIQLNADRAFNPGTMRGAKPIDLRKMTQEVNLFEDVMKGYVTAKLVIIDDAAIFSEIVELQGTEELEIRIKGAEENRGTRITLHMKVVSIISQVKANDRASVFVINAISDHGYRDALSTLSRSYTGQLEDTAEEILKSFLNVSVKRDPDYFPSGERSVQGDVKVLIPYISPLESTEWLMERAAGKEGSPYFSWASVWDQNTKEGKIRFGTFKTMLAQGISKSAGNRDRHWWYSAGTVARKPTAEKQKKSIVSFEQNNRENTLSMINQGTVGSRITNLDTYTSQDMDKHFSLGKFIEKLKGAVGGNAKNLLGTVYDEDHMVEVEGERKESGEHDARQRTLITSYGTYGWQNSYHDVFDPSLLVNKIRKSAVLSMLYKNVLDVTVTGFNVMGERLSAGDIVVFAFDTQIVDDAGAQANKKDERTSGFYLILNTRHLFTGTKHRVIMSCAKVADLPGGF